MYYNIPVLVIIITTGREGEEESRGAGADGTGRCLQKEERIHDPSTKEEAAGEFCLTIPVIVM